MTGAGAGGFEQYYLEHRRVATQVRDAHNLYLETLDELGWIGLALLLPVLAIPLVAAARARRHPIAIAALGVLVAYLVEAGVDWMWEVALLTLIALACAAMLVVAAREERPPDQRRHGGVNMRVAGVASVVALVGLMLPGIVGHRAGAAAGRALERGDWNEARDEATTAIRWAPWWAWGHQARGDAEASLGRTGAARADLREAARKDPGDWRIWFDLGAATRGPERLAAWRRAAQLNPLGEDIRVIRPRLLRAPARR